jgi:hypothetical protein
MQVALKEFAFGVRHDEMLDDTFLFLLPWSPIYYCVIIVSEFPY